MNTRAIASEYQMTYWAGVIRERQESGLSVKAFCEARGFHDNIYFYWQRKLREAACVQLTAMKESTKPTEDQAKAEPKSTPLKDSTNPSYLVPGGWTVCKLDDPVSSTQGASFQNKLHVEIGRCRIVVTDETNHNLLAAVYLTLSGAEAGTSPKDPRNPSLLAPC